jgi:hypothetical protein
MWQKLHLPESLTAGINEILAVPIVLGIFTQPKDALGSTVRCRCNDSISAAYTYDPFGNNSGFRPERLQCIPVHRTEKLRDCMHTAFAVTARFPEILVARPKGYQSDPDPYMSCDVGDPGDPLA